jgi:hypothetical protein
VLWVRNVHQLELDLHPLYIENLLDLDRLEDLDPEDLLFHPQQEKMQESKQTKKQESK